MFDCHVRNTSFAAILATVMAGSAAVFVSIADAQTGRDKAPYCDELPKGYQGQCKQRLDLNLTPPSQQQPAQVQQPAQTQQQSEQIRLTCSGGEQFTITEAEAEGGIYVVPPGESESMFLSYLGDENNQDFYSDNEVTLVHNTQSGEVWVQSYDGSEVYLQGCYM